MNVVTFCSILVAAAAFYLVLPLKPKTIPGLHEAWEKLNDEEKKSVAYPPNIYPGGNYVQLPHGETRYWIFGPDAGKKIVLIHGLTISAIGYIQVATSLADQGFRVLVYDLYGRGYSSTPAALHDGALYVTQLALLLKSVGYEKTNFVGWSMGGAIAVLFTQQFPEMVDRLALISPAGLVQSSIIKFVQFPGITHILLNPIVKPLLEKVLIDRFQNENGEFALAGQIKNGYRYQLQNHRGFFISLVSTLKNFPLGGLEQAYKDLGTQNRPVLVIWGTSDTSVPYRYSTTVKNFIPQAYIVTVPKGTHGLPITHPVLVADELAKFFS